MRKELNIVKQQSILNVGILFQLKSIFTKSKLVNFGSLFAFYTLCIINNQSYLAFRSNNSNRNILSKHYYQSSPYTIINLSLTSSTVSKASPQTFNKESTQNLIMSDKRKNSQRNKKKTSKKSAYQGSEQLQDLDIEQQQVKMSNKNSSQELSKKQEASEMMIQMQIQSKELKSSPLYSKPYSRIKERQIQKVEVRKYLHENQDQSQNSKNFNNFESSHKIISNDSEVNIGYQYNDGYNNHIQPPKRQFNSLDSQLSSWGQIQSPKMQIPQRGNIITEVEKRPNEKATQLIKVQNINDKNYTDTRQKAIQTVRNILYLCSADPAEFKKFIPPPQIRQKVKTLLTTCEDKVNLYEIVSKQVQLANYEYQNCNNQKKPELELHLANYLNEQGNCLLDTGKYSEAIKAYQKCTPILEKSFNENCNKISQQNPSIFSRAKSWFSRSQNYERKQQRKSKAGDSFKTLSNKFPVLIDSLDSLTKCYDLVMNRQIKFDLVV